jgi:hypothetical protein
MLSDQAIDKMIHGEQQAESHKDDLHDRSVHLFNIPKDANEETSGKSY